VTCEVLEVKESGIEVKISGTDFTTSSSGPNSPVIATDQRAERFAVGEKVDARVIQFDKKARKVQSRSRRWKSPKRRRPSRSTAPPTRGDAGRHSRHRAQAAHRQ